MSDEKDTITRIPQLKKRQSSQDYLHDDAGRNLSQKDQSGVRQARQKTHDNSSTMAMNSDDGLDLSKGVVRDLQDGARSERQDGSGAKDLRTSRFGEVYRQSVKAQSRGGPGGGYGMLGSQGGGFAGMPGSGYGMSGGQGGGFTGMPGGGYGMLGGQGGGFIGMPGENTAGAVPVRPAPARPVPAPSTAASTTAAESRQPARFELQSTNSVLAMARVRTFTGPNGITALDLEPGRLLPIGFNGLRDADSLNNRAYIAGQFNDQLANIRVDHIQNNGSGRLTLSDGTSVPYNLCRYTVNNNGSSEQYDAVLAQVRTGNFLTGTTRWMVIANQAGQLNMDHARDFAARFHPRNGFSQ